MPTSRLTVRVLLSLSCLLQMEMALSAQMSGNYTVDPSGSGARNFKTLNAASQALEKAGVNGAVCVTVAFGVHNGRWVVTPIKGTSATNTVTFKALGTTVTADAQAVALELKFAHPVTPIRWLTFDGFTFEGKIDGRLVGTATSGLDHVIVRNCAFPKGGTISLWGTDHDIHHNRFKSHGSRETGVHLVQSMGCDVHHNILHGGYVVIYGLSGRGAARIYNNLIYDLVDRRAILLDSADRSVIAHNTMIVSPEKTLAVVDLYGRSPAGTSILGNVFVGEPTYGKTTLIKASNTGFRSDGNVFFAPAYTSLFSVATNRYGSLAAWQNAGSDKNSVFADPRFKRMGFDYGLTFPSSPGIDKAIGTPSYVTDDLAGNSRDSKPDAGCFEVPPFETFGGGCFGTGLRVPRMGSSGSPALGSKNFAFTLRNALGGSRAFFVLGESIKSWNGVPLPLGFGSTCKLRVAGTIIHPLLTTGTGPGNGAVDLRTALPSGPSWRGRVFFAQWAVADGYAPQGLAFSNAGRLALR